MYGSIWEMVIANYPNWIEINFATEIDYLEGISPWAKVKAPSVISADQLDSLIAIGIYDSKKKIAYMCHFAQDNPETDLSGKFCKWVRKTSAEKWLTIYVVGGRLGSDRKLWGATRIARARAESSVRKYFPNSQPTIIWSKLNAVTSLTIKTQEGEFIVKDENFDQRYDED